jgi:hypothetical protein
MSDSAGPENAAKGTSPDMRIIYWDPQGPAIYYHDTYLYVDHLDKQERIAWPVSRFALIKIGIRAILAALQK